MSFLAPLTASSSLWKEVTKFPTKNWLFSSWTAKSTFASRLRTYAHTTGEHTDPQMWTFIRHTSGSDCALSNGLGEGAVRTSQALRNKRFSGRVDGKRGRLSWKECRIQLSKTAWGSVTTSPITHIPDERDIELVLFEHTLRVENRSDPSGLVSHSCRQARLFARFVIDCYGSQAVLSTCNN